MKKLLVFLNIVGIIIPTVFTGPIIEPTNFGKYSASKSCNSCVISNSNIASTVMEKKQNNDAIAPGKILCCHCNKWVYAPYSSQGSHYESQISCLTIPSGWNEKTDIANCNGNLKLGGCN